MAFKVGDMVIRTAGDWRGVKNGDINKVSGVRGGNIQLEGFPDLTFDGDNFKLHEEAAPAGPRPFKIGDRVRLITDDPAHGLGEVCKGDIGVVASLEGGYGGSLTVDFPNQEDWEAEPEDLEHVDPAPSVSEPEMSLDEAVGNYQNVVQQIKELQTQAANYERLMRRYGLRPVSL